MCVSWRLTHKLTYALCSRDRCSGSDWEAEKCDTGPQTSQKKLKFIQKNTNSALQKKHICELQWKLLLYLWKWKAIRDCMAVILWSTLPKKGKKWNLKRLDESSTAAGSILNHPVAPSIPSGVITSTSERSGLSWELHQCLVSPNTTLHSIMNAKLSQHILTLAWKLAYLLRQYQTIPTQPEWSWLSFVDCGFRLIQIYPNP